MWRTSHPFDEGVAVRVICWFPLGTDVVVVALFAGDKAQMGDVFYNSVGSRADAAIEQWLFETRGEDHDRQAHVQAGEREDRRADGALRHHQ